MTKEVLDLEAEKMSWDEQNWLFNRLMGRLWPKLAGKRVLLDASSVWLNDEATPTKTLSGIGKSRRKWNGNWRRGI